MSDIAKVCFDKILPRDLRAFSHPEFALGGGRKRLAVFRAKKWPNGSVLRVRFMNGSQDQHDFVKETAPVWTEHANLKFDFNNAPDAEIRITFDDDGAWSYVGTDCLDIPVHAATMNYGWLDEGVVFHEFGHAIGLIHEHQNPKGGVNWDKAQVYKDLAGPPNFWSKETVDHNIFKTYAVDQINATDLDKDSIMLYAIPGTWTLDDFHSEPNEKLSSRDKSYIGDEVNYPFGEVDGSAVELTVTETAVHAADIGRTGERDLFTFTAVADGIYTVETDGPTDMVMSLYGPNSPTILVAEDDDSGAGRNAKIAAELAAGTYYVQVRHYNLAGGTGAYSIKVLKQGESAFLVNDV